MEVGKFQKIKRFEQVIKTFIKFELGYLFKDNSGIESKRKFVDPKTVRQIFESLGGTFIKLAQFLSLRPDLIPHEYCLELAKLQDDVKPFSFNEAKKIIEKETGKPLKKTFSEFNKKTIAAASIGQVYLAKLINGEKVAVKIKRPGIEEIMKTDLSILFSISKYLKKHLKSKIADPIGIVQELKDYTQNEMSYLREVTKIQKFYINFDNSNVKIPKVYKDLISEKMIVMEYIEGKKLSDYMKTKIPIQKRKELAECIVEAFFKQVFEDGVFHADPHPGNILVLDSKKYPDKKIALLDYGITGEIDSEVRKSLVDLFSALLNKDINAIITAMGELHIVDSQEASLKKDMREMLGPYYGVALSKIDVPKLFMQSLKVAKKNNIQIPKDYVLLGKSLITVESVCGILYPEFNFVESSKPYVTKLMLQKYSPLKLAKHSFQRIIQAKNAFEELPDIARDFMKREDNKEKKIDELSIHIKNLEWELDRAANRFIKIISALILLITGFIFRFYPPIYEGISIVSWIAYSMALLIFLIVLSSKH